METLAIVAIVIAAYRAMRKAETRATQCRAAVYLHTALAGRRTYRAA